MSWKSFEFSTANGRPVSLYEFKHGDTKYYRYTNADRDVNFNGHTWSAIAISDSGLSAGTGNNMEVLIPSTNVIANLYRGVPPSKSVQIRIYRLHIDDRDAEFKTVWVGVILEVKRESTESAKLVTTNLGNAFIRNGLRLTYGRSCPYALYDHNCRVKHVEYAMANVRISALDGAKITVNFPSTVVDGWFSGGYVEFYLDEVREFRGLKAQNGNNIGIIGGTKGLSIGMFVTLFPGCDRTIATCNHKFKNHLNYGGQPHMPGVSPFQIIKLF